MKPSNTRRDFLRTSAIVGPGFVLTSCSGGNTANSDGQKKNEPSSKPDENKMGGEVTATEDLMRERSKVLFRSDSTKHREIYLKWLD